MTRSKLLGCLLGLSSMLLPARLALGDAPGSPAGPSNEAFLGVWAVEVTPDQAAMAAGRNAFKDFVLFEADGKFTAEAFGPMGFGQSEFTVTELDGAMYAFSTTMTNPTQGTLVWNGVRQGNEIVGTLVWTKSDGAVGTYSFRAEQLD